MNNEKEKNRIRELIDEIREMLTMIKKDISDDEVLRDRKSVV